MSEQTRTPGDDLGADKHRSAPSRPASNPGRVGADHKISVTAAPVQPGGIRHLCLRGGQTAAVDADVFARVSGYSWRLGAGGYVVRTGDDGKTIYLHREIMIAPTGMLVTFLSGNHLDLRRANLRVVHRSDIPRRRRTKSASGFRGVVENPITGRYAARIRVPGQGKQIWLQEFETRIAAAECYDAFARAFLGELAVLNFPMRRFDPMQYRRIPTQFHPLLFVDAHSPGAMSEDELTRQVLPSNVRDSHGMSTEREQDTLRMVDGTSSAQHAGSVESTGVYAGVVADGKVVCPAPGYGHLFCVSGSSPPSASDLSVPPSAERDDLVEPSIDAAPANALAAQAFSPLWHSSIADLGNQFEPQPVRTGVRHAAAGLDTPVVGSAHPAARHGRSARAGGPSVGGSCIGGRATCALNSAVAPLPRPTRIPIVCDPAKGAR